MSPVTPPEVKDTSKRTKIFDWTRADQGRQRSPARSAGNCSGCPRAPRRRPARSWRGVADRAARPGARRGRQAPAGAAAAPARRDGGTASEPPARRERRGERVPSAVAAGHARCSPASSAAACCRAGVRAAGVRPRPAARHLAGVGVARSPTQPRGGDLQVQPERRRHARRGARLQRPGRRGRQPRRLPPRRQRALDGRGAEAASARRHLHGDLPGDLGRHPHRLRRPGVQHRPRRAPRRGTPSRA